MTDNDKEPDEGPFTNTERKVLKNSLGAATLSIALGATGALDLPQLQDVILIDDGSNNSSKTTQLTPKKTAQYTSQNYSDSVQKGAGGGIGIASTGGSWVLLSLIRRNIEKNQKGK